jgi:organic radical activating enzyme
VARPREPLWSPYELRQGRIHSAKCEINVTEHCNLSCRACSHLSPVLARHAVDPDVVGRDLSLLARHYRAQWIRLVGGEPLLHPALLDVIEATRRSGVGSTVCVVTNGVLLPGMPAAFWNAVDRVDVSQYPGKELSADDLAACTQRADAAGVELRVSRIHEFRESYSEVGTGDDLLVQRIYESCVLAHVWRNHTVADGFFYKCPPSYFLPKVLPLPGVHDGIRIEDGPEFGRRLLRFLESQTPLASCRNCLGSSGARFAHGQTARAQFRERQRRPTEELVDEQYLVKARPARLWRTR